MKLIFLTLVFAVAAVVAVPVLPEPAVATEDISNNEMLISDAVPVATEEDWQMIPDGDGAMHLVDVNALNAEKDIGPRFVAHAHIIFRLFTRYNQWNPQVIGLNNVPSLRSSYFNPNWPTRVIIHGWNNNGDSQVNTLIRTAYLQRGDFNVITVDWSVGANNPNYHTARWHINDVGQTVAWFLDFLNEQGGMRYNNVYVIGHSLGGHAAGATGKRTRRGRIEAIFSLDPANPLFNLGDHTQRIHYSDANYVEIMHTDVNRLGMIHSVGHASFYPSWGTSQPGCGFDPTGMCSHSRAPIFFAESINSQSRFWGTRCNSFNDIQNRQCNRNGNNAAMGGEPASYSHGIFFLDVNGNTPFAQGWR